MAVNIHNKADSYISGDIIGHAPSEAPDCVYLMPRVLHGPCKYESYHKHFCLEEHLPVSTINNIFRLAQMAGATKAIFTLLPACDFYFLYFFLYFFFPPTMRKLKWNEKGEGWKHMWEEKSEVVKQVIAKKEDVALLWSVMPLQKLAHMAIK